MLSLFVAPGSQYSSGSRGRGQAPSRAEAQTSAVPDKWRADGDLKCPDDIVEGGVGAFPDTLLRLFSGENFGKLMIKVAD